MDSFKRLQFIYKTIEECYPELLHPEASTLFFNFFETIKLKNIILPNKIFYSPFKNQSSNSQKNGFESPREITKNFDSIIISIPKSREEALGQIALAYQKIKNGGLIFIEGSKRLGIDGIIRALSKKISVKSISSKAHGKIVIIKVNSRKKKAFPEWLEYNTPSKNKDGFFSMPGLFSHKKIDPASEFLASIFDTQISGDVVDLGTGWGYLSSKLLSKCPMVKSITLIDHDQRAIDCSKKNVKSSKARFKWIDISEVREIGKKFDNAICNPPFHSNEGKSITLGQSFITAAHETLSSKGSLLLVANIQLPYENTIKKLFNDFEIYSQNKYFKIILAKRPKRHYDRDTSNI